MSLHYLVKYECQKKWHYYEIRIAINDELQGSLAKNLRRDEFLYYTFIIHSADQRIFTIGEHLAKLRAKSLNVSLIYPCLLYTSPSPRDRTRSRMPSSA